MKIIHQGGFSDEERIAYRAAIYQNLLESALAIVFTMRELSIKPVDIRTRVRNAFVPSHTPTDTSSNTIGNRGIDRILRTEPLLHRFKLPLSRATRLVHQPVMVRPNNPPDRGSPQ